MTGRVLILGGHGRFGSHAAQAFSTAGWTVSRFDRKTGDLPEAVRAADVVVNGWNPPDYSYWARDMVPLHQRVIEAAQGTNATVILPGNVYVFGADTPLPWSERSTYAANNPLGRLRIEIETAYKDADLQTIVLRGGDFLDTGPTGNWFDLLMVAKLAKGRFVYPGRPDFPHAWAFLPDMAQAAVALAQQRAALPRHADIPFPGYTLTGAEIAAHLNRICRTPVRLKTLSWWPLQFGQAFVPKLRGLCEMRYLWNTPHQLDPHLFQARLPAFNATPVEEALRKAVAHTGALEPRHNIHPDQAVTVQR